MILIRNHSQTFRPLLGGIAILAPRVNRFGTLGCVATSDGNDRWILTAFHVLAPSGGLPVERDDPVYQPVDPEALIARVRPERMEANLDVAAAEIIDTVPSVGEILGIGKIRGVATPSVGMRVIKSGAATGVTQGRVVEATADRIEIVPSETIPSKYQLSEASDSGAVWLEEETHRAVALHRAGHDFGTERAIGVPMERVLTALELRLVTA